MTDDQIEALIHYVRSAVKLAVAEAKDADCWEHNQLDEAESELRARLQEGQAK